MSWENVETGNNWKLLMKGEKKLFRLVSTKIGGIKALGCLA